MCSSLWHRWGRRGTWWWGLAPHLEATSVCQYSRPDLRFIESAPPSRSRRRTGVQLQRLELLRKICATHIDNLFT